MLAQRALDRRLTEELMRFKTTISSLTDELTEVKEHDKQVTHQARKAQDDVSLSFCLWCASLSVCVFGCLSGRLAGAVCLAVFLCD